MSSEEAKKDSTNSDSNDDDETYVIGSIVESSKTNKLKKFDFITEDGTHIHLTEEEINHQKKLEEDAKAEAVKQEGEIRKSRTEEQSQESPTVILVWIFIKKDKNEAKRTKPDTGKERVQEIEAEGKFILSHILTRKGPITLKVYREDDTSEIIPEFKASDLHLGEWREVVAACPNKKGKGWMSIYKQIQERMDYLSTTEAELRINLANERLKSSIQYKDHPAGTVLNEPVLEIFFRLHQGLGLDDHARTFSSLLLAEIDKRNLVGIKRLHDDLRVTATQVLGQPRLSLRVLGKVALAVISVAGEEKRGEREGTVLDRFSSNLLQFQTERCLVSLNRIENFVSLLEGPTRIPLVSQSSHLQTDDEVTPEEAKQVEVDDQATHLSLWVFQKTSML
ncbi:hypothetical protein Tco_0765485 [Tanacetum coccineum]